VSCDRNLPIFSKQGGAGLVEILVTLILLGFLFTAIFRVHLSTKRRAAWIAVKQQLSHQEILLSTLLSRRFRSAGYNACDDWSSMTVYDHRRQHRLVEPMAIMKNDFSPLPSSIRRRLKSHSSVLMMRQLASHHSELTRAVSLMAY